VEGGRGADAGEEVKIKSRNSKEMKITVRFENTDENFKVWIEDFLKSLELDPEKSNEDQEVELNSGKMVRVFFHQSAIIDELLSTTNWLCAFKSNDHFDLFEVNGIPWGCYISGVKEINKILEEIPKEIYTLSIINALFCSLPALDRFYNLTTLSINKCEKLNDIAEVKNQKRIKILEIRYSNSLCEISPIHELENITHLDFSFCKNILNISPIAFLYNINELKLISCNIRDINPLKELRYLELLDLSKSPVNEIVNGDLITKYSGMTILKDISSLKHIKSLKKLNLSGNAKLCDISSLSDLLLLNDLNLTGCFSIENIDALKNLARLNYLGIRGSNIKNISVISNLKNLKDLDIMGCEKINNLSPITSCTSLESLSFDSPRVQSIEPLREISSLRRLERFNPPEVAECLAHAAVVRADKDFIYKYSEPWLLEATSWSDGSFLKLNRFATTLGEAFSLLGEHDIEFRYEEFLRGRMDFSSTPWNAWLEGTRKNSGVELMRQRINRQEISTATPGCIGGICTVLPEGEEWSRQWLSELEKKRSGNAKELLPVAPEICLAYARLGEMEALGRWLERLTDPSDPGALDELQVSLARWRLSSGDLQKARSHISAIHSPTARDPILAELVLAELAADPDTASENLLLVQGIGTRGDLAKKLAAEPTFTSSESRLHRLLVAAGENPTALAELITLLGASVPSEIVNRLSAQLGLPQAELQQWRISQLQALLKQLQTIAKI